MATERAIRIFEVMRRNTAMLCPEHNEPNDTDRSHKGNGQVVGGSFPQRESVHRQARPYSSGKHHSRRGDQKPRYKKLHRHHRRRSLAVA